MNYTANHHLPQWASSDRVRMEDFNQMNKDIEAGLTSANANASAAVAKAEAAYSPDNLPYVIGSYTGTGKHLVIDLGFMPSFLIVSGMRYSTEADDTTPFDRYFAIVGGNGSILGGQLQLRLQMRPEGFGLFPMGNLGSYLPDLNEPDRLYYYIAFR